MNVLIVAGGEPPSEKLLKKRAAQCKLVIAADAGFRALDRCNIVPDMLIGDMDSLGEQMAKRAEEEGAHILRVPSHKNSTDTELAVDEAVKRGATKIILLGATGGRVDHLLGNLMLLRLGDDLGVDIVMEDDTQTIVYVRKEYDIHGEEGQTVSIIPSDREAIVRAWGLEYPLDDLLLTNARPRGVSNVMCSDTAGLETDGPVFVCMDKTADAFK